MQISITRLTLHIATTIIGLVAFTAPSQAHQQWLAPNFVMQSGEKAWLSFDHTFGDQRFLPSSGPSSYYTWWIVGPDGLKRSFPHMFLGKTRAVGEIELTDAGTYRLEAVEDMMAWTLLKIDGEDTWQPGTRADFPGKEVVRSRRYFSKSVSYVTLEAMSKAAVAGTGDPLEIVFDQHPNDLYAGKAFKVRVLASGKAVADQEVRVFADSSEGHDATDTCSTDASGYCDFELPEPGRYLLATNTEGETPEADNTDGFSFGYSIVIAVQPAE
ncbi:MAG: DUF4198 domain-containing protein [Pseudomonadota bacterium]